MKSFGPGRAVLVGFHLASLLLVWGTQGQARSCVQRALGDFPVIFHGEIVQKLANNRMRVRLISALRGPEVREALIVGYGNVMVWTDRDPFHEGAGWIFAFDRRSGDYELVLCATAYLPLEDGTVSVNIDGSGTQDLTVEQIGDRLEGG